MCDCETCARLPLETVATRGGKTELALIPGQCSIGGPRPGTEIEWMREEAAEALCVPNQSWTNLLYEMRELRIHRDNLVEVLLKQKLVEQRRDLVLGKLAMRSDG